MLSPVPMDVHLWTCITCMKSVGIVSAVVHTLSHCLSASSLFIAHLRTLNSRGTEQWHRNTKKTTCKGGS